MQRSIFTTAKSVTPIRTRRVTHGIFSYAWDRIIEGRSYLASILAKPSELMHISRRRKLCTATRRNILRANLGSLCFEGLEERRLMAIFESFETGLPTSYGAVTSYTLSSGTWTGQASGVIRDSTPANVRTGLYSAQLRSQTDALIRTPSLSPGVGQISFWASTSSGTGGLQVSTSPDGTTFTQVTGSPIAPNTTIAQFTFTVNDPSIRFVQFRRSAGTVRIDDVSITDPTLAPPALTTAPVATVDAPFEINFADNPTWRTGISAITVGGTTLAPGAYSTTTAGKIVFTPSASALLQSAGTKSIVITSTGFTNATVSQLISAGVATQLLVTTPPTAPASNGAVLATQPVVSLRDQYNNPTTSTATVTATVGAGTWSLGGTTSATAVSGVATFADLTATSAGSVSGATITFTSGALTQAISSTFNIPGPPAPALTAAIGATVDNPFIVTFPDNSSWRAAITGITVGGVTLSSTAYVVSDGQITFTPSASTLLQTAGSLSIVVTATDYANATLNQAIAAGVATQLGLTTQPTAPLANGGLLVAQPVVRIRDQYGNTTDSTATVTAAVDVGSFTLGGTTSIAAASGTTTFTNLTATSLSSISGATIVFSADGLTSVTSSPFNIPSPPAPALTAAVGATVDAPFSVTFADNASWRSAITGITVGGIPLTSGFTVDSGTITFDPSTSVPANLLQLIGTKTIVVSATGFANTSVSQSIAAGVATNLAVTRQPVAPATGGGAFTTQPIVRFRDQYNNFTSSTATVTATVGAGTWALGGTTTIAAVSGTATFAGLTATATTAVAGATIAFASTGLTGATSNTFNLVALPAPATPTFASITSSSFTVNWTAVTNATGYRLDVATDSNFTSLVSGFSDLTVTGTSQSVTGLGANTPYFARVRSVRDGVSSVSSGPGSITTLQLGAPTTVAATAVTPTGFTANWNTVTGASGYRLDVFTSQVTTPIAADLFISEYLEGSTGTSKYLEIFNGTSAAVNLSDYRIRLYANGANTPTNDNQLSGTLPSGGTIVLSVSGAALTLPEGVTSTTNSAINFNGDDAIALFKISTNSNVDIFGQIGTDPGSAWTATGISTVDSTLRRKSSVTSGVTVNPSSGFPTLATEWDSFPNETASGLGSHSISTVINTFVPGYENLPAGSSTSATINGLAPGITYNYVVRAISANSTSVNSNATSVTTSTYATTTTVTAPNVVYTGLGYVASFGVTTVDGAVPGASVTYAYAGTGITGTTSTAPVNVGEYTVIATFNGITGYSGSTSQAASFSITPAPLTVTAESKSKFVGDADPAFTFTTSNFVNGETVATALTGSLTRVLGEDAGTYAITEGSLAAVNGNYAIAYVGANLTINPTPVAPTLDTVTVNGADIYTISPNQRSQVTSLVLKFSAPIVVSPTDFTVANYGLFVAQSAAALASSQILVSGSGTDTITLRWASVPGLGGVVARGGTGVRGNSLADGNWQVSVNPAKISGSTATDKFFRLYGDSNGDGLVTPTDLSAFRASIANYNPVFDWDGNNSVSSTGVDYTNFLSNYGRRRRAF